MHANVGFPMEVFNVLLGQLRPCLTEKKTKWNYLANFFLEKYTTSWKMIVVVRMFRVFRITRDSKIQSIH